MPAKLVTTHPWSKSYCKGCGTRHIRTMKLKCSRPIQAIGSCILRMVHLSKSCGGYQYSSERSREVNSGSASYTYITPCSWGSSRRNTRTLDVQCMCETIAGSTAESSWSLVWKTRLSSILLPFCQMMTKRNSSIIVWGNKQDEGDQSRPKRHPSIP